MPHRDTKVTPLKTLYVLVVLAAFLSACDSPAPETTPVTNTVKAPLEDKKKAPDEIRIGNVVASNPVLVDGEARTFENNVVIRLRDERGALIVEDFVTSNGEMGHHNPFHGELFVTRDPGSRVTVEALEYSAKDGAERSLTSRTIDYPTERMTARLFFPAQNPADCTRVQMATRTLPKSVSIARLLVEALLRGPVEGEQGVANPFPKGSDVVSVILRNGVLTVDLNERLQNVGGSCAAQGIRASVETTLKQLPAVREVVITAGGSRALALQP